MSLPARLHQHPQFVFAVLPSPSRHKSERNRETGAYTEHRKHKDFKNRPAVGSEPLPLLFSLRFLCLHDRAHSVTRYFFAGKLGGAST